MKFNISMDDNLLKRVDNVAKENYMTRSGLIAFACTQYINTAEVMMFIKDMSLAMRKIADQGTIDEETKKQLEDFERLCKMMIIK